MHYVYTERIDPYHIAIADLVEPGLYPGWLITRINTPVVARNRGFGTRLLQRIIDDADKDQVWLFLAPQASGYDQGGLDQKQLVDWYKKYDFCWARDFGGGLMYRWPR